MNYTKNIRVKNAGKIIRKIRKDSGITMTRTAKFLGISVSALTTWEQDRRNPSIDKVSEFIFLMQGSKTIDMKDISFLSNEIDKEVLKVEALLA